MFPSGKSVIEMEPQLDDILKCPGRGLIVSAVAPPDSEFDFISRFFCPKYGLNEDPVCGGAHCALAPYWSQKLGKFDFVAHAVSLPFFPFESLDETIVVIAYYRIGCVICFAQASPRGEQ
ncbi:hypothetical protein V6N13_004649 [Hibiscus sabdariffa]